ncbi:MAG: DUF4055 domain-containing protein [Gemmatimonas sp.]|jgi:hypothetical protein|uniref:DUF4055 domain-containing protein n=1 Tax=Gemmatimonas sp. TaxID=1962908 RepID=UPI00391F3DE7
MTAPVIPTIPANAPPHERPDFKHPAYVETEKARRVSRALMQGTEGVRALGPEALPKWPAEEPGFYRLRARIARLTRYYERTVEAVVGMIVASPPTFAEGPDARILADWEDIDRKGTHGDVFVRELTQEAIVGGFAAILVDAPPVPEGVTLTLANQQRMRLRPYWVLLRAEQLISWIIETPDMGRILTDWARGLLTEDEVARLAAHEVLRQVVIYEPTDVATGTFGTTSRNRYRVLRLESAGVTYTVWEHVPPGPDGTGEHFRQVSTGTMTGARRTPLPAIPLAIAYPKRPAVPFVSEPAFFGVAELNLDHYGLTADRRYLIKHTHSPTLYMLGVEQERDENGVEKPVKVGPNSVIRSRNADAKVGYAAAPADALTSSKEERDEIVRQIAALGMSFIAKDRQQSTETAKGRTLDLAAENATHATVARGVQDALEQALVFHAAHYEATEPSIEMHPAFAAPDADPQIAALLWQAVLNGRLDVDTWLDFLRTGRVPENVDVAAITGRLLAEMEAAREVEALAARDREVMPPAGEDGEGEAA